MLHIIIKQERRKAPRELAISMNTDILTPNGTDANGIPQFLVTPKPPQLHTMGTRIDDMSNIDYAAEWDGQSPWINVITGSVADLKMGYLGWPTVTQAEWEAANPIP